MYNQNYLRFPRNKTSKIVLCSIVLVLNNKMYDEIVAYKDIRFFENYFKCSIGEITLEKFP